MRAAAGVVPIIVGKAVGVVLERRAEELPDGGGLGCAEVRRGDPAECDVGCGHVPRLPDSADWMANVWDLRSVPAGRCTCAPSISDAANDPRLPVTFP